MRMPLLALTGCTLLAGCATAQIDPVDCEAGCFVVVSNRAEVPITILGNRYIGPGATVTVPVKTVANRLGFSYRGPSRWESGRCYETGRAIDGVRFDCGQGITRQFVGRPVPQPPPVPQPAIPRLPVPVDTIH